VYVCQFHYILMESRVAGCLTVWWKLRFLRRMLQCHRLLSTRMKWRTSRSLQVTRWQLHMMLLTPTTTKLPMIPWLMQLPASRTTFWLGQELVIWRRGQLRPAALQVSWLYQHNKHYCVLSDSQGLSSVTVSETIGISSRQHFWAAIKTVDTETGICTSLKS